MRFPVLCFSVALMFASGGPTQAEESKQDFKLVNKTGYEIKEVYVSPTKATDWQEDILGEGVLPDLSAVDERYRGKGHGRFLLADALFRAARSEIASFAVIVDAKDEGARRFYERESFLRFPDQPLRLFRAMGDITALFK